MSYNSEDFFLSREFKNLLNKFNGVDDNSVYVAFDPDELMDVAEYYYNSGDRERALSIIDNTLSVYPGSVAPLLFKARIALLDENDVEKAESITELIDDKTDLEYTYMKAEIMLFQGQSMLADNYLEDRFNNISAEDSDYFAIDSSALFLDYNCVNIAEKWLKRSGDTECAEYKEQAARISVEKGEYERSKQLFNELIDKDPFSIHYWNALASTQFFNNNIEDSIQSSEYSIAIDPENSAALLNKANGLYNLGNFSEALKYYKRYNKQCPNDENGEMLIGFCHLLLDEYEEAIAHLEKAEKLLPPDSRNLVDIYKDWAFALCRMGQMEESAAVLDKTDNLDCDHNEIMVYRGNLLLGCGYLEDAKECFMQALRASGFSPAIVMKIAITIYESGDLQLAYKMFRNLYDNNRDWNDGYAYFAACCYDLGKTDEFLAGVKKAAENTPLELKLLFGKLLPKDMQPSEYYQYLINKMRLGGKDVF